MFKMFLLYGQSLPSLRPPLTGYVEEMGAPADRQKALFNNEGTQGGVSKGGGDKAGKVYPAVPLYHKIDFPSRLRIAALEAGFASFKTEIASMFATLTGRFTASHPPGLQYWWVQFGRRGSLRWSIPFTGAGEPPC